MLGGGSRTFLDPIGYEVRLGEQLIEAVIAFSGPFAARMTSVELHHMQLLRCEEEHLRVAHLSLAPKPALVTFPILSGSPPVWCGVELQPGDILFHSHGERLHQRMQGRSVWGVITLNPEQLEDHSRALHGTAILPPSIGKVLRPPLRAAARLRRLHAQACRLAETKVKVLTHPEVARAIEQGLMQALVCCLTAAEVPPGADLHARHAGIMLRFEEVLGDCLTRALHMSDLCRLVGVSGQTLRASCAEFLGMSPGRYVLLRRLRLARLALNAVDPASASIADIARACGFARPAYFTATYRAAFGEQPSVGLGRAPRTNFSGR